MRDTLTEEERKYVKENIFDGLQEDINKVLLFGNTQRASIMLEGSIRQLKFDKKKYETRIVFDKIGETEYVLRIQARAKDCEEVCSFNCPIKAS